MRWVRIGAAAVVLALVGCRAQPLRPNLPQADVALKSATPCPSERSPYPPAKEDLSTRDRYLPGGLYRPQVRDRSPGVPLNIACIAEPEVKDEPRSNFGNQSPYTVLAHRYDVLPQAKGYVARGLASYYGVKFHGRLTSNHEVYDMYAFTAAHRTLPLPSFALVTNVQNGASVVVRVNDRGPFHSGRIIDLSYAAAMKLGIVEQGTAVVEVRAVTPDDKAMLMARHAPIVAPQPSIQLTDAVPAARDQRTLAVAAPRATRADRSHFADGPVLPVEKDKRQILSQPLALDGVPPSSVPARPVLPSVQQDFSQTVATVPADLSSRRNKPHPLKTIQLQVASFAVQANADRALAQLVSAGIGAQVNDVADNGHTRWRISVYAPNLTSAYALAKRISRLGFDAPHIVSY